MIKTECLMDKRWTTTYKENECFKCVKVEAFSHYGDEPRFTITKDYRLNLNLEQAEFLRDALAEILEAVAKEKEVSE